MKIVVPENIAFLLPEHIDILRSFEDTVMYVDLPKTEDETIKRIGDAEIVIVGWVKITSNILDHCQKIKYIIALPSGIDSIDKTAATKKGIKILNCPTYSSRAVAEHTMGLVFAVSRHIVPAQMSIQKGKWKETPYSFEGVEVAGKKIGIIGLGQIGGQIKSLAAGVGMEVLFADKETPEEDIDTLIATADFLSLNLPYTKETYHLINARRLGLMKKTAFIVNTSRGELIDQKELIRFLKEGRIAGAAIDVFEGEPVNEGPSQEIIELVNLPNVIATPHIGFNTKESAIRHGEELLKNIRSCMSGTPINLKN